MDKTTLKTIKRIGSLYGEIHQQLKLVEETAELVSATMHLARRDLSDAEVKEWRENYVEELGDVIIVTTQLRHLLSKEEKKALERSIKLKVVRQRQRIAAQLTQAAEIIEAQEKRRQAGLSFSPYEAHKEVLRAAADFDELRTIMEARS